MPKGVLLPGSAIVQRNGKSVVFAIEGDRAVLKAVVPGQNMGELRLVEGIANAVQVVREPPAEMQDGSRITLKK